MAKRLTIKQQEAIAAKSRKMPEPSQELPSQEQQPADEIESESANSGLDNQIRDRQVNVKFTSDDIHRLKKAAASSHRPVANYIYHTVMDKISNDGY
jgi:predicted DNA binding CopG/RHH family protein